MGMEEEYLHSLNLTRCLTTITNDTFLYNLTRTCEGIYDPCLDVCHLGFRDSFMLEAMFPVGYSYPIYGVAFPILLLFLVTANIFVVLVLSKKHMATPTNTVLFYMAISDFFVGIVPFPFTFFYFTLGYHAQPERHEIWWCYMGQFLMSILPPVCHGIAIWLTVLLAAQRYIYIEYPVAAQKWCTIPYVRKAALILTVLSLLSGILKVFEVTFMVYSGYVAKQISADHISISHETFCAGHYTFVVREMTIPVFYNVYMWTRVLGFLLLPSVILIVLNILLIFGLRKATERRNRLLKENRQREANRQKESNSTNLMLVIIVSIFLIVNLPQATFLVALSLDSTFSWDMDFFKNNYANLFVMIDNMLIMATYPVNFAIYCSMSTQFRETFKRIFCHTLPPMPTRQGSVMMNNASYSYLPIKNNKRAKYVLKNDTTKLVKNGSAKMNNEEIPIPDSQDDML